MEFVHLLILAVVQGLTEFIPVSSSGHLVLLEHWFGSAEGDLFLNVVLHVGTLGSVLVVYRREVGRLLRFDKPALRYLLSLAVGTAPAVVVGFVFKSAIENAFGNPMLVGGALIFTALLLWSTRLRGVDSDIEREWTPRPVALPKALAIGCAQAVAITPGISRSGSTIVASIWLGLPRAEAARFSFLLSVPAIGGALLLQLLDGDLATRTSPAGLVAAAAVAFVVGIGAIRITSMAVIRSQFWKFSLYCLPLGILVLIMLGR